MPTAISEGGWLGRGQGNFLSFILEAYEPQAGQWHEDVKRNWEYYHIVNLPERTWNFTSRKKRTSERHIDGILQKHALPQVWNCYQAAYLSMNQSLRPHWLYLNKKYIIILLSKKQFFISELNGATVFYLERRNSHCLWARVAKTSTFKSGNLSSSSSTSKFVCHIWLVSSESNFNWLWT